MKVSELIAALQAMPQEANVVALASYDGSRQYYTDVDGVSVAGPKRVVHGPKGETWTFDTDPEPGDVVIET